MSKQYNSSVETTANIIVNKDDYYQTSFVDTDLVQASLDEAPTRLSEKRRVPQHSWRAMPPKTNSSVTSQKTLSGDVQVYLKETSTHLTPTFLNDFNTMKQ